MSAQGGGRRGMCFSGGQNGRKEREREVGVLSSPFPVPVPCLTFSCWTQLTPRGASLNAACLCAAEERKGRADGKYEEEEEEEVRSRVEEVSLALRPHESVFGPIFKL